MVNKKEYEVIGVSISISTLRKLTTIDIDKYVKMSLAKQLAEHIVDNINSLPIEFEESYKQGDRYEYSMKMCIISKEALKEYKNMKQVW